MKQARSFRFNLLFIFAPLLFFSISIISYSQYIESSEIIVKLTNNKIEHVSQRSIEQTKHFLSRATNATTVVARSLRNKDILKEREYWLGFMWELLLANEHLASLYIADKKGNFLQVRRTPEYATRILLRDKGEYWFYRNKNYDLIKQEFIPKEDISYNPLHRSWYKASLNNTTIHISNLYIFSSTLKPGITTSFPILNSKGESLGVVGADITLASLSNFLASQKISEHSSLLLFNAKEKVLAFSKHLNPPIINGQLHPISIEDIGNIAIIKAYQTFLNNKQKQFELEVNNRTYLVSFSELPHTFNQTYYMAILVPKTEVLGNIEEVLTNSLTFSFFILLLALMLLSFIAKRFLKTILELLKASTKMQNFHFTNTISTNSSIKELRLMQTSLASMQEKLKPYKAYLPLESVKTLIKTEQAGKLENKVECLSMLFSDIDNFTSFSETSQVLQTSEQLNIYFSELNTTIQQYQGFVEHYRGDEMFSFWGAPKQESQHALLCCKAALACQKNIKRLNRAWQKEKLPELITRFGIHTGESIVGNIGSLEQMHYMAYGKNVLIASRLEQINKLYGSNIAISEVTYELVKDHFLCRPLDSVTLLEERTPIKVYELIKEIHESNKSEREYMIKYHEAFEFYQSGEFEKALSILNTIKQHTTKSDKVLNYLIAKVQRKQQSIHLIGESYRFH